MTTSVDEAAIGRVFREESGRSVATLARIFGSIDLAEDVGTVGDDGYQPLHATRAHLLRIVGRHEQADQEFIRAAELAADSAQRAWLERQVTGNRRPDRAAGSEELCGSGGGLRPRGGP